MTIPLPQLHHVQVLSPADAESAAGQFYGTLLGLAEIPRPMSLAPVAGRGVWFALAGGCELHVGVRRQDDQPPRCRAHFALQVDDFDAMIRRLRETGILLIDAPPIPGIRGIYAIDPFDNRIELIQRQDPVSRDEEGRAR